MLIEWDDLVQNAEDVAAAPESLPSGFEGHAKIVSANFKPASTGAPGWGILWQAVGGPQDGKTIWQNLYASPSSSMSLGIFFRDMAALGISKEWFAQEKPEGEYVASILVDREAKISVGMDKGGKGYDPKPVVKRVGPLTDAAPAPTSSATTGTGPKPPAPPEAPF